MAGTSRKDEGAEVQEGGVMAWDEANDGPFYGVEAAPTVVGQQCGLNQEALEKALAAADEASPTGRAYSPGITGAIRTYLASLPPVDSEPVAWRYKTHASAEKWSVSDGPERPWNELGAPRQPLYAHSAPQASKPVANDLVERLQERSKQGCGCADCHLITEAAAAIIALQGERDAARQALERDRSVVIAAVNEFSDAFARRSWLLESRGPYEWDDDKYRDEFKAAYDELSAPIEKLKKIGGDWANCPTDHDEIMRSRIDWKARAEAAEAEVARLKAELAEAHRVIEQAEKVCAFDWSENDEDAVMAIHHLDRAARSFRDGQKTGDSE